jgi:hypothetical protein
MPLAEVGIRGFGANYATAEGATGGIEREKHQERGGKYAQKRRH